MNPFRLFNPFYTLRLEREVSDLHREVGDITAGVNRIAMLVDRIGDTVFPAPTLAAQVRNSLLSVADAMATGRTNDAKVMVDAMVLILGGKDAA